MLNLCTRPHLQGPAIHQHVTRRSAIQFYRSPVALCFAEPLHYRLTRVLRGGRGLACCVTCRFSPFPGHHRRGGRQESVKRAETRSGPAIPPTRQSASPAPGAAEMMAPSAS